MHYHHSFHAGNFADVFKHVVLCALLRALNRKDTPWCYVETHAGAGLYDLASENAQKTAEWHGGIGRLPPNVPSGPAAQDLLGEYLGIVRRFNEGMSWRHYPGSPMFAAALARAGDRLLLCEKVEHVAEALKDNVGGDRRVVVHLRDGYEAHALLPPREKRGLVLVDPPFERPDEFDALADFLGKSLARFANGVYALWYPYKNRFQAERFERRIARECGRPVLALRFDNGAPAEGRMRACGILVVNPPYRLAEDLRPVMDAIAPGLAQGPKARIEIEQLSATP